MKLIAKEISKYTRIELTDMLYTDKFNRIKKLTAYSKHKFLVGLQFHRQKGRPTKETYRTTNENFYTKSAFVLDY